MKRIKQFTSRMLTVMLAGTLAVGSLSVSAFGAEDAGSTVAAAEEFSLEEATGEAVAEPSSAEEAVKEGVTELPDDTFANTTHIAAEEEAVTSYTVTLDANGGYFVNEWDDSIGDYIEQAEVVVKQISVGGTVTAVPIRSEQDGQSMVFAGWSLERDGVSVSTGDEEYTPVENCVLCAIWKAPETVVEAEEAVWEEVEEEEVDDEDNEQNDAAQETEDVENTTRIVIVTEEEAVEEDTSSETNTTLEIENEQDIASDQEADYGDKDVENINEISSNASVAEEETQSELNELSQEDETFEEEAAKDVAESGSCGENLTWTLDEEGILTISGTGDMWDEGHWFIGLYSNSVTSIIVEQGVTRIGDRSFDGCSSLEKVVIPSSVLSIGDDAFEGCSNLNEVIIQEGVTSIGNDAFSGCSSLENITIPCSMLNIGDGAFGNCDDLKDITLSEGINSIGDGAFVSCDNLQRIVIPSSVSSIGNSAFYNCGSLSSVEILKSKTSINFGDYLFSDCNSLTDITIQSNVDKIGVLPFYECWNIANVHISQDIVDKFQEVFNWTNVVGGYTGESTKVSVSLSDDVTVLPEGCFSKCRLIMIDIPDTVKSIGANAFESCIFLEQVLMLDSVENIGKSAFSGCEKIKDFKVSQNISSISDNTFEGCLSLQSFDIPNKVQSIGKSAFFGCSNLTNISMSDNITSIGDSAFGDCSSLTNVLLPDTITSIGDSAFSNCANILSISIPERVTEIGNHTFFCCTNLKKIVIPMNVSRIGSTAFYGCESLTSFSIPTSLIRIEEYTFYNCSSLENITIPNGILNIDEYAFDYCSNLASVKIPNSVEYIGKWAFGHCDNIKDVYFAGSEKEWGRIQKGTGNWDLTDSIIHYDYEMDKIIISLDSVYEGASNKELIISADISSKKVAPDSSTVTWTLSPSDGQEAAITWGTMTVQTGTEGKYQISIPVTITEAGKYTLRVEFEGISAQSVVNVNEKNKIHPTFELSTDTISYKNESLGEKLQLTLKANNVLSDGEIDSLSQDQKDALCFHVESIDFKIEGTPVAYFSQVGDEYTQKYEIVPLDDGLDIPIGEEKVFADFEVLTNPPVVISDPVQRADIIYTIKGTIDGKTIELSDKKTVTFLYDFNEEKPQLNYTEHVDEWVNNEGTRNSIKYLTNSSNFIHYLFVTEKDSGVGGKVTKTLSDLIYRGIGGLQELGADTLSEQEAEQILVDFLNDNQEEVISLARASESSLLGETMAEGFKQYMATIAVKDKTGIDISDLDEKFYERLGKELSECLLNGDDIDPADLQLLAKNGKLVEQYNQYLKSVLYAEKVSQILGDIGKGVKILSVGYDTLMQMEEIWTLQIVDDIYIEMLDYIRNNCAYAPVKTAAERLSGVISKEKQAVEEYAAESLINFGLEIAEDKIIDNTPEIISFFTKTKNALSLYTILSKAGFDLGVFLSNTCLHTEDNQELKDRMRILTSIGDTLGNWIDEGLSGYTSSKGLKKMAFARHIVYGEHILIKTRKLGEISYQKLCENVSTESCDAYRVSKCITSTLATFETWMNESGILDAVGVAGVYCPVDVDVCDEKGNTLLTIKDGKEDSGEYGDIQYWSIYNKFDDDYMKIVTYPDNKNYTLRCNGRGEGEVSAFYQEYDNEGCSHCITFEDIPVEKDTVITMDSVSVSSEQFKVKSNGIEEYCTYEKTQKEEAEHSFTSWEILRESTCGSHGLKKRSCDNCSKTEVVELPLQEHNWNLEYTIDTVPTSTTPGQKSIHCRNCGTIKEGSVTEISALDAKLIDTGGCGDQINWALYDNGDLMISGSGIMSNWNNTNNFSPWHDHATDVKRVILTSGIESVGDCAFYDCTNLKEVLIPESIYNIGRAAFRYCESLGEVVIPECVTKLQTETFCRCTNLKKVHLSRTLTSIDQYAFSYCSSLNEITIPETVESLGQGAFQHCTALTGISLPDGIRTISNSCFYQCSSLKKLVLPARLEAIENYAINRCINLTEIVIPDSVNTVGEYALAGSAFKRIVLPEHLERLGKGAFYTCQNLEEIAIPAKITELGKGIFYGCDKLAKVILSDNIKSIESDAFTKCNNVTIYGLDGSYAQTFAETQNIPFISHNGHNFGEWEVIKAATLEELGLQSHTCKICGMEETQIIPKLEIVSIDDAVVTGIDNMLYTGKSLTQALVVELGSITLKANIDYTVTYKNNINAGTAALTITGIGNYEGTITKEFIINPAPISKADVTGVIAKTYTGKAITQTPTVILGSTTLARDKDYTISYKNNTNAGTATVTFTGKGNYTGTRTETFTISPAPITKTTVTGLTVKTYTGKAITQTPVVKLDSSTLIQNTDYTVSFKNNVKAGTATVTITGKGNYTGTRTATFKINKATIAKAKVTCPVSKVWTGWSLTPVPTVKVGTMTLKKGTDFSLAYKNNKNVGTATITITGKGNYTGTIKKTFKINPKPTSISKLTGGSKKFTIGWKKQASQTSGYQILYSSRKDFKTQKIVTVSGASKTSQTLSGLAKKHKYYVRIRTYKTIGKAKYYSTWSAAKTVTTK